MTGYDDVYKKSPCAFALGDLVSTFFIRQPAKLRPTIHGSLLSLLSLLLAKKLLFNIGGIIAQSFPSGSMGFDIYQFGLRIVTFV